MACGILVPRPGIKPTFPALEGGFFTPGPPGKSLEHLFICLLAICISSLLRCLFTSLARFFLLSVCHLFSIVEFQEFFVLDNSP